MILPSIHNHTKYSDGSNSPEELIKRAIEMHMPCIGLSEHVPVPFHTDWHMNYQDLLGYKRLVEGLKIKYSPDIDVFFGFEADYIPKLTTPNDRYLSELDTDFIIGSIHYGDFFDDGAFFVFDSDREHYLRGVNKIYKQEHKKLADRYFEIQMEMLDKYSFDFLAHCDKIMSHADDYIEDESWYLGKMAETFELAKQKDVLIEINTKSFTRKNRFFPHERSWKTLKDSGCGIIINSDSHSVEHYGSGLEAARERLLSVGIRHTHILTKSGFESINL
ncbi:MAG: histidinol-phosphatase HisJ family protein [Bacteroidales bacterium]